MVTSRVLLRRMFILSSAVMLSVTGCAFNGLNTLPLPGATGRGPDANSYFVEVQNVGTLEANSPVLVDDVIVGSIKNMSVDHWHANVEISVKPDVVVPANVVAAVGQTSLLGSMHLELNLPKGPDGLTQKAQGRLQPGAKIPLTRTSTYPSTEQTLSSLSVVINSGGLSQIGDIIHNFNAALSGRGADIRDLLQRLDKFVGVLDQQRDNIVASIQALNRLGGTFANQRDVITQALYKIPPALDVLLRERPRITTALNKLGTFSDTATKLVNDAGDDLARDLRNLAPTIGALADVGPDLDAAIAYAPTYPFTQNVIDRVIRGDFVNGEFIVDLTNARLRKGILLGTHWGRLGAEFVPGPDDPQDLQWQYPEGGPVPPPVGQPLTVVPRPGPPPPGPPPASAPLITQATPELSGPPASGAPLPGATPVTTPEGGS